MPKRKKTLLGRKDSNGQRYSAAKADQPSDTVGGPSTSGTRASSPGSHDSSDEGKNQESHIQTKAKAEKKALAQERKRRKLEAVAERHARLQRNREERLRAQSEKEQQDLRERIAQQVGKGNSNLARLTDASNFPEQYVKQHDCGTFTKVCQHCKAFTWAKERSSLCCKEGSVVLPPIPPLPQKLAELYNVNQTFLQRIRDFNNAFALASLGCNQVRFPSGVSYFKVQGKIHHFIGSLLPTENETPKFAQLYFHDSEHELTNRSMSLETFGVRGNIRSLDRNEVDLEGNPEHGSRHPQLSSESRQDMNLSERINIIASTSIIL